MQIHNSFGEQKLPLVNATHWSVRTMAKEMGISHTSVQRIWAEHNLEPHLVKSFKVSTDPKGIQMFVTEH